MTTKRNGQQRESIKMRLHKNNWFALVFILMLVFVPMGLIVLLYNLGKTDIQRRTMLRDETSRPERRCDFKEVISYFNIFPTGLIEESRGTEYS